MAVTSAAMAATAERSQRAGASEPPPTPGSLMLVWVAVLLIYCAGAAVCGTLAKHVGLNAIWLPIGVSAVVVCAAVASSRSAGRATA